MKESKKHMTRRTLISMQGMDIPDYAEFGAFRPKQPYETDINPNHIIRFFNGIEMIPTRVYPLGRPMPWLDSYLEPNR